MSSTNETLLWLLGAGILVLVIVVGLGRAMTRDDNEKE